MRFSERTEINTYPYVVADNRAKVSGRLEILLSNLGKVCNHNVRQVSHHGTVNLGYFILGETVNNV